VGSALVRALLRSTHCTGVSALVRRAVDVFDGEPGSEKLQLEQIDFDDLEVATRDLGADSRVAFCTMGIGQPRKVTRELFWKVDVEYSGAFARGAAAAGVRHISLLSSVGASPDSRSWYVRVKGAAEKGFTDAGITRTSIFRPSLLVTKEIRYGLQDRITQTAFPLISPLLPSRYREIRVEDLGRAMTLNAERPGEGSEVLYYDDFHALLSEA
jgi:uncharacterized protein YbjT (DUF2867 family)